MEEPTASRPAPALHSVAENLRRVREEIARACRRAGRRPQEVELVAVTKTAGLEEVRALWEEGVRDFGESRVQAAAARDEALEGLEGIRWHLIGHLQRNKAARALRLFHAIHSLDSRRLLREIEVLLARDAAPAPAIYIEVNVAGETRKTGLPLAELPALLEELQSCPLLKPRVRGLMTMAPYSDDSEASRPHFRKLRELRDRTLEEKLLPAGGLSMGMSSDFEVAIEEGATSVRVGTRLFER
jgi:pyridoxal phosphate enzyme (YggS family)